MLSVAAVPPPHRRVERNRLGTTRFRWGDPRLGVDHEQREVAPAVGPLGERMLAELLGLLRDLLAAERLVEQARAVGLQHPEVEAEEPLEHEVAGAGAPPLPAPPPPLVGLPPGERGDLRVQAPGWVVRL